MAKSYRPYRRAKADKNHDIVPKALKNWGGGFSRDEFGVWQGNVRGLQVAAYDTSMLGGQMTDWLVAVSWMLVAFEVKQPRPEASPETEKYGVKKLSDSEYYWGQLKEGERQFMLHSPLVKFIVSTEEQVWIHVIDATKFVFYVDDIPFKGEPYLDLFFPGLKETPENEQFQNAIDRQ